MSVSQTFRFYKRLNFKKEFLGTNIELYFFKLFKEHTHQITYLMYTKQRHQVH